jgi:hypothetical protein
MRSERAFIAELLERFDSLERAYRSGVGELLHARSAAGLTRERINYLRRALKRRGVETPTLEETSRRVAPDGDDLGPGTPFWAR